MSIAITKRKRDEGNRRKQNNSNEWQGRARPGQVRCRSDYKDLDEGVIVELILPGPMSMQVKRVGNDIVVTTMTQTAAFAMPEEAVLRDAREREDRDRKRHPWAYKDQQEEGN